MLDHALPLILDYPEPQTGLLAVIEFLLKETAIYEFPEPAEVDRPDLPYTSVRLISDEAAGLPLKRRVPMGTVTDATPDVREVMSQQRDAIYRVTQYGHGAHQRARILAAGYTQQQARLLWGAEAIRARGTIQDATRTIGQHHEQAAYQDYSIRYRAETAADHYSIQSVNIDLTLTEGA